MSIAGRFDADAELWMLELLFEDDPPVMTVEAKPHPPVASTSKTTDAVITSETDLMQ